MLPVEPIKTTQLVETTIFNEVKYQSLAYQVSPYGSQFMQKVEDDWSNWLTIVQEAKWLKHWRKSPYYDQEGCTPKGEIVEEAQEPKIGSIALLLYTNAVWGFGIEGWLKRPMIRLRPKGREVDAIRQSIIGARNEQVLYNSIDTNDSQYKNLILPLEYQDLDNWLEALWLKLIWEH